MQSAFLEQSFHKAQKYMKNGDKKNALLIYNKVLDKFPKNLRAINALNNINHELLLKEQSSINEQEYIVQLYNNGQITEGIIQCKKLIKMISTYLIFSEYFSMHKKNMMKQKIFINDQLRLMVTFQKYGVTFLLHNIHWANMTKQLKAVKKPWNCSQTIQKL